MASIFRYRNGWRAQAIDRSGKRHTKDFPRQRDAHEWVPELGAHRAVERAPELGGPTVATLANVLRRYAELYTVHKRGAAQELCRINHYLAAAGLPLLMLAPTDTGKRALKEESAEERDKRVPPAWQAHLARRREQSHRTYEAIGALAKRRVSTIGRVDIDQLMAVMALDQHSPGTIQKEVALLKHCFNKAIANWNWVGFRDPCLGIKLGSSETRFVKLSRDELGRLYEALSECDNPHFWPLVDCATARLL